MRWFSNLSGSSKGLVIGGCVAGVLVIVALVVVLATGGFTSPF